MASRFRKERVRRFAELLPSRSGDVNILDVGGTANFWRTHREALPSNASVTILNRNHEAPVEFWIRHVPGDARDMHMFRDCEFDVCFSNSVIEHVGNFEDQNHMAAEIRRVSPAYFVQTPNLYFPLEPHFLVPGWQFLPLELRALLLQKRRWGWMDRVADPLQAKETVRSIRLLSAADLRRLFPDARVYRERIGPFTKSITAWRAR